jgi:hypothetical protein
MPLYIFLHNLSNVLVQIANKMGLPKIMGKEAVEWDILFVHGGRERTLLQRYLRCRVFPLTWIYDGPLLCDGCYRTLPMWEVTTVAKFDMQGLGEGALNVQITKGGGISIRTGQLIGPGVSSRKCIHNPLRQKPSSLFLLQLWSTTSITSLIMRSMSVLTRTTQ